MKKIVFPLYETVTSHKGNLTTKRKRTEILPEAFMDSSWSRRLEENGTAKQVSNQKESCMLYCKVLSFDLL